MKWLRIPKYSDVIASLKLGNKSTCDRCRFFERIEFVHAKDEKATRIDSHDKERGPYGNADACKGVGPNGKVYFIKDYVTGHHQWAYWNRFSQQETLSPFPLAQDVNAKGNCKAFKPPVKAIVRAYVKSFLGLN